MVGGKKNLEEQMESLPEEHIKRQANQKSTVFCPEPVKTHTISECRE